MIKKSIVVLSLGEVLELKPKSGLNQDNSETIFLLRWFVEKFILKFLPIIQI